MLHLRFLSTRLEVALFTFDVFSRKYSKRHVNFYPSGKIRRK